MNWKRFTEIFNTPLFTVGQTEISLVTLLGALVMIAGVLWLSRFFRRLLRTRILARTKLDVGLQYLIARIGGYVVLLLGLVVGLQTIGVNLSVLAVIAGALGVGIGFGLQNIVHNFVSGLILMGERSVQIGDRVEVGDTLGRITRIGGRATTLQTNDNIVVIVPNSEFVSDRVVNWSHSGDPRVRLRLPVGVAYDSDPREVERLLLEVATANPHILKDPAPKVIFLEFGDNALSFELRFWTAVMMARPGAMKSELNFAIWDSFKKHGIKFPYPQRDIHITEPVRVELTPPK